MTTIKALIIDDEPLAHDVILQYSKMLPGLEIIAQAYDATEAFSVLQKENVDLIFLDINMPRVTGLSFLRSLPQPPNVIITTAYEEYALEGFELEVSDYLLKPFRFERFAKAMNKLKELHKEVSKNSQNKSLFIKVDKKQIQVRVSEIYHLESFGNYVKVWLEDSYLLTPKTLSYFEAELGNSFLKIHKSYLVQKSFISHVEGNKLTLKNSQELPIGKSHKSIVKAELGL